MKIISIEPTPSPNSMKLNMDESLPSGVRETYTKKNSTHAPEPLQQLLAVQGVISVFHAADFIAVDRTSKGDWQFILARAREIFGEAQPSADGSLPPEQPAAEAAFGEAQVLVQMFRGIPLQVRVRAGAEEVRVGMPERFTEAAVRAGTASPNLIKERKLEELGVRYGELADIAGEVVQELDASYDDARVESLVSLAMQETSEQPLRRNPQGSKPGAAAEQLRHSDWKLRYAALQKIQPSLADAAASRPCPAGREHVDSATGNRIPRGYQGTRGTALTCIVPSRTIRLPFVGPQAIRCPTSVTLPPCQPWRRRSKTATS